MKKLRTTHIQLALITRVIASFLICTLTMMPLALLSHTMHEMEPASNCTMNDSNSCDCCQSGACCDRPSDQNNNQHHQKCHCFCFSNMLTILPRLPMQFCLIQEPLFQPDCPIQISPIVQDRFRPPRS